MKPRIHYLIPFSCLLVLAPSISHAQSLTKFTESDIEAMMNSIDSAARKGNVDGMIAFFAPDIMVTRRVLVPGGQ